MARHAKKLPQGNAAIQHLGVGVLSLCFPLPEIEAVIAACGRNDQRTRDLPAALMVYYAIALSLFPEVAYQGVLRWLIGGLQWLGNPDLRLARSQSLSDARLRLGELPLLHLHEKMARPLAQKSLPGSYFKDLLLVAFDGSTLALQDTPANNEAFGRSSNQAGDGAWPLARFVALVECGTHLVFAAKLGAYKDPEITLAKSLTSSLHPGMLCMADRLFPSYALWKQFAATGAHLLWRAKNSVPLQRTATLSDGSYLATWLPKADKRLGHEAVTVRVIEYRLQDPGAASDQAETYRLITTILNPAEASARELAGLYPQRWEIEITIKEAKAILRKGGITLRSKQPELVRQEFWGMILAHYLVRKMMAQAALSRGLDPDGLSYQGSVEIIKFTQAGPALSLSPSAQG